MHFLTLLLLFFLPAIHAAPYPQSQLDYGIARPSNTSCFPVTPSPTPQPEALAGVYICSDANFSGSCIHHFSAPSSAPSACVQLDGTATSVGPDKGFVCTFFTNAFCDRVLSDGSDAFEVGWPGYNDLRVLGGAFNDGVRSYFCLGE